MKLKRIVAIMLCVFMILSLAACGNSKKTDTSKEPSETNKVAEDKSTTVEPTKPVSVDLSKQDPVTLTLVLLTDGADYADTAAVDQKVSDLCETALNTKVKIERVSLWDYSTTMNLKLSSGEACDIFESFMNYNTYADNGYLLDLEPYKDLMPDALKLVGDYAQMGYTGGHLYSVTSLKDLATLQGYILRKDWVEETGIDLASVDTMAKFGDLLRAMKKNHPDATPLTNGTTGVGPFLISNMQQKENGGFTMCDIFNTSIGIGLMDPVNSPTVSSVFTTDTYKKSIEFAYQWAKEGLIAKSDISSGAEQVRAGTSGGYAMPYKPGVDIQEKTNCDTEMKLWTPNMNEALATTNNSFAWSVNTNCKYPERAVQLLNYLYTNEECMNLLSWGIEGKDYVFTDKENKIINYPNGVDSSTVGYSLWSKFGVPNTYLQYLLEGSDPDQWNKMDEFNKNAKKSVAFGFAFDSGPVTNEASVVTNIVSEYNNALTSGLMDPSEKYDEFIKKMKDAGLDKVIAEAQKQLDTWLASK
jgi:ABC-type sugar transport system, periplasmic component